MTLLDWSCDTSMTLLDWSCDTSMTLLDWSCDTSMTLLDWSCDTSMTLLDWSCDTSMTLLDWSCDTSMAILDVLHTISTVSHLAPIFSFVFYLMVSLPFLSYPASCSHSCLTQGLSHKVSMKLTTASKAKEEAEAIARAL